MAVITATQVKGPLDGVGFTFRWGPFTSGDTCAPLAVAHKGDKTIHIYGEFGGGQLRVEGTLLPDGPMTLLRDAGLIVLDNIGSNVIREVLQLTGYIGWVLTGGAAANLTVDLLIMGR
jgi:hypothetical protein